MEVEKIIDVFDSICKTLSIPSELLMFDENTGEVFPDSANYEIKEAGEFIVFNNEYVVPKEKIKKAEKMLKELLN